MEEFNDEEVTNDAFLEAALVEVEALTSRVAELETERDLAPPLAVTGSNELRSLATTYRTALRNGHPDAQKHLEALLVALGA